MIHNRCGVYFCFLYVFSLVNTCDEFVCKQSFLATNVFCLHSYPRCQGEIEAKNGCWCCLANVDGEDDQTNVEESKKHDHQLQYCHIVDVIEFSPWRRPALNA